MCRQLLRNLFILVSLSFAVSAFVNTATATPSFNTPTTPWNAVTTFNSIGLYWAPTGKSASVPATVRFREQGSTPWRDGFDLWYDTRNGEYRGSLVELQSNKTYEIQLKLGTGAWTDVSVTCDNAANGECNVPATTSCSSSNRTQCTRTWNESYPIKRVIDVRSGNSTYLASESGSETEGYVVYQGVDGDNTITMTGGDQPCVRVDAKFVVIRNLKLVGCGSFGIELFSVHYPGDGTRRAASDVWIEDNEISGWGRSGYDEEGAIKCNNWHETENGNVDSNRGHRFVIQRNNIHSPRYSANAWDPGGNHPRGPQAVFFNRCGRNHVIRYNDIYSANGNNLNDGIGGAENFGDDSGSGGFPWADSDINGNRIQNANDDGIEAEGDNRNVRIWGNYLDHVGIAIANAATAKGPLYVWRNVSNQLANMKCPSCSEVLEDRGPFIKGGGKSGSSYNGGIAYYFHNTILQAPGIQYPKGAGYGLSGNEVLHNFVSRNNIWHIHRITSNPEPEPDFFSIQADCDVLPCNPPTPDNGPAADFDVFNGRIFNAGPNAEMNSVNLGWGALGGNASKVPTYLAGGDSYPTAIPSAANNWTGDFRLAASSLGTSNAPLLKNFNDLDSTRHVGAQPPNKTEMKFGRAAAGPVPPSGPTAVLTTQPSPANIQVNQSVTFNSSSTPGSSAFTAITLDFGDGSPVLDWLPDHPAPKAHTYTAVGNPTATLTVTTSVGTHQAQVPITVTPPCNQPPTANLAATPLSGDKPLAVNFNGSGSTAVSPATITTYSITYGDGGSGTGATQSHTYTTAGTFPATLTVTDSNGCQDTDSKTITVNETTGGSTTVTLQQSQSYTGASDNWIICCSGADLNKGGETTLDIRDVNSDSALLRFAIFQSEGGPVPNGATITSAMLSLYKYWGPDGVFNAFRLLKNWSETQSTWNNAASGTPWTSPGALSAGNDYVATADGQGSIADAQANGCGSAPYPAACWLNIDVTSGVQAFASGTPNYGWKLSQVSSSNIYSYKDFNSKENQGFATLRPKLTIQYSSP
jgi:PKD repeat protein